MKTSNVRVVKVHVFEPLSFELKCIMKIHKKGTKRALVFHSVSWLDKQA